MIFRHKTLRTPDVATILATTLLIASSGCGGGGDCELQEDCDANQICDVGANLCVSKPACTTNADCEGVEQCLAGDGEGGVACRMPANCTEADDINAYCREKLQSQGDEVYECNTERDVCVLKEVTASTCVSDEDCAPEARCLSQPTTPNVLTCRAPLHCGEAADAQRFCEQEAGTLHVPGTTYTCAPSMPGEDPMCMLPTASPVYRHVLIQDTTSQDCESMPSINNNGPGPILGDAGSDLTFAALLNENRDVVAWGDIRLYDQGYGDVRYHLAEVIDGTPPTLLSMGEAEDLENMCPYDPGEDRRFTENTVVTLGCTGSVVVRFQSVQGEIEPLREGQYLQIGEYAPVCNEDVGGAPQGLDSYEVYLCPPTIASNETPSQSDCVMHGRLLAPSQGGFRSILLRNFAGQ